MHNKMNVLNAAKINASHSEMAKMVKVLGYMLFTTIKKRSHAGWARSGNGGGHKAGGGRRLEVSGGE